MNPYHRIVTALCYWLIAWTMHGSSRGIVKNWMIGDHADVSAHCFIAFAAAFVYALIIIREWTHESDDNDIGGSH